MEVVTPQRNHSTIINIEKCFLKMLKLKVLCVNVNTSTVATLIQQNEIFIVNLKYQYSVSQSMI